MNPYELRFSILNTAKEFLEQQYKANLAAFEAMDKSAKEFAELAPKFPTVEEVIEKAVEINKFVSDANERELAKIVKRVNSIGIAF
jgi:rhamnose utilization protein RhaD (predicted bifunctional aldolase and dehydrogenase)